MPPDVPGLTVPDRILLDTPSFVVVSDISPLLVGHLLILPKAHILSVGAFSDRARTELEFLLVHLQDTLRQEFGQLVLMEHGSDSQADGGGCVAHAHLHVVPDGVDISASLRAYSTSAVESVHELTGPAADDEPYIYLGDYTGRGIMARKIAGIQKQFLRIEIARAIGLPAGEWDWRSHILSANLVATVERVGALLGRKEWKVPPPRTGYTLRSGNS